MPCVLVKFSTLSLANHVEFDFFVSERCFAWSLAIWSAQSYFHTTVWSLKKCKRVGLDTHALQPFWFDGKVRFFRSAMMDGA